MGVMRMVKLVTIDFHLFEARNNNFEVLFHWANKVGPYIILKTMCVLLCWMMEKHITCGKTILVGSSVHTCTWMSISIIQEEPYQEFEIFF